MSNVRIKAGPYEFEARMEEDAAPKTCAKFAGLLPYRERIIHVRWSGEGCWIPLGELDLGLNYENHTSHPAPGDNDPPLHAQGQARQVPRGARACAPRGRRARRVAGEAQAAAPSSLSASLPRWWRPRSP